MGGTAIISATCIIALIVAAFAGRLNIQVIGVLAAMVLFGIIGFIDDYEKAIKKNNLGLSPKQKIVMQFVFSAAFGIFAMFFSGGDMIKGDVYKRQNEYDKNHLTNIISKYGEERWASRIADFIVKARKDKPIETTFELVDVIKAAIPASARRTGPHPAKRTFQAIRIEVNDELSQLEKAVEEFCDVLNVNGR